MSFEEVYSRISQISSEEHRKLVNYIRTCQPTYDLAEECLQNAYLEALIQAESIKQPEKLKAWLITVALRTAKDQIRDHCRIVQACYLLGAKFLEGETDVTVMRIFVADVASKALKRFPLYYTEVMRLRDVEDMSYDNIGIALGITSEAARTAHHRVQKALKRELKEELHTLR